ncbi:MAG: ribonuclease Y [Planctomycetaceae bacterium]|nr:ribonuclease Y [Planctomycetaceae bacterium]
MNTVFDHFLLLFGQSDQQQSVLIHWIHNLAFFVGMCLGAIVMFFAMRVFNKSRKKDAESVAKEIIERAENEAETKRREVEIELKEEAIRMKDEADREFRTIRHDLHERERLLDKRQDTLEKQGEDIRKQEKLVETSQRRLAEKIEERNRHNEELKRLVDAGRAKLHEISGMTREEARQRLLKSLEGELQEETGSMVLRYEKSVHERCEQIAREKVLLAIQRYAAAHTAEATTSTVDIPNDDMKGRIIGREGRNIRAFEKATGVDVIIDDTPGVVIVSAFDAIRREVARLALSRLIADGRIHPSRIEEIVQETDDEIQQFIQKAGVEACEEVDIHGLNDRIVNLLGRLYFRTSYSQNVLRHSIEVAFLSGLIAAELGLDQRLARRCGLLHDIGKAADHELEGGHPKIGADLLKRYGEPFEVVQAAHGHHDDLRIDNPYTIIVAAADACSASRPGARRETLEHYIKRMEELEAIANEFPGVEQAYAVQAGREMRVLVSAAQTTDESAAQICRNIVKSLNERLQFPGEIKVTVIRETRCTEVAK